MTPTICSGKKRHARSDMRHTVRRSHLNLALKDIVNYDCQRNEHFRISGSLRSGEHSQQGSGLSETTDSSINEQKYRQLLVDISDNAVTSSTHLDGSHSEAQAPIAIESKLRSRFLSNNSSYHTISNTDNSSSFPKGTKIDSQYAPRNDGHGDIYDESVSVGEDGEEQSRSTTKYKMDCESDMVANFDTEKDANAKRDNHPLWRDKMLMKHSHNNKKPLSNIRNTEGLLSIAIKTIQLVKRNNRLQQRLTQLQLETFEFIQSVMSNEENRHFRANIQHSVREVENV